MVFILLSLTHLKRILKELNLKRKKVLETPLEDICKAILQEIETSGSCLGYRTLWKRLTNTYNLKVRRNTVLQILRLADPNGIHTRKQRRFRRRKYTVPGPNFLWHFDGYDKLKPFGFAVHGAIDGFSRHILWLKVSTSNNNPQIIAYYFLKTVHRLGKVPRLVRTDKGTENVTAALLQKGFRLNHDDSLAGHMSYIAGKSTSNQKIECWWSQMRRLGANWWISYFKDLRDRGIFIDSDPLQVECLRYCYGHVLQYELNTIAEEWNRHHIRKQKNSELPAGKPNVMYFLPEIFDTSDYGKPTIQDVNTCLRLYSKMPEVHNPLFAELVELLFPGTGYPLNIEQAFELYCKLINTFLI